MEDILEGSTDRRTNHNNAWKHGKIYEKYNFSKGKVVFFLFFVFVLFGISGTSYYNNRNVFIYGTILYVGSFFAYYYMIFYLLQKQELARNAEGLLVLVCSYFAMILMSCAFLFGILTKNLWLAAVYVAGLIVFLILSYARHEKTFDASIGMYIDEKQIDIKRGIHNIARAKGKDRWSKILHSKSYDKKQGGADNISLYFKWFFVIDALTIVLCKSLSENFKFYLMSVLAYFLSLSSLYFAVFYFVVLRFILRMEKEHGYEFRMVYEPDPEPIEKEPTRAQKRKSERMLAKEQQTKNKRN